MGGAYKCRTVDLYFASLHVLSNTKCGTVLLPSYFAPWWELMMLQCLHKSLHPRFVLTVPGHFHGDSCFLDAHMTVHSCANSHLRTLSGDFSDVVVLVKNVHSLLLDKLKLSLSSILGWMPTFWSLSVLGRIIDRNISCLACRQSLLHMRLFLDTSSYILLQPLDPLYHL